MSTKKCFSVLPMEFDARQVKVPPSCSLLMKICRISVWLFLRLPWRRLILFEERRKASWTYIKYFSGLTGCPFFRHSIRAAGWANVWHRSWTVLLFSTWRNSSVSSLEISGGTRETSESREVIDAAQIDHTENFQFELQWIRTVFIGDDTCPSLTVFGLNIRDGQLIVVQLQIVTRASIIVAKHRWNPCGIDFRSQ